MMCVYLFQIERRAVCPSVRLAPRHRDFRVVHQLNLNNCPTHTEKHAHTRAHLSNSDEYKLDI